MLPEEYRQHFKSFQLIIGIIEIVLAIWMFMKPEGTMMTIAAVIGIVIFLKGIFEIYIRNWMTETLGIKPNSLVVLGIIDIIAGLLILFNTRTTAVLLPAFFAIYIIVRSLAALFTISPARAIIPGYVGMTVIVSILGILIGAELLLHPFFTGVFLVYCIAIYLLISGIENIVYGFLD